MNDNLMADQWFAAPVLSDEGEQPVLDPVPFAGTGWQMADGDRYPEFVGQDLQFPLPQAQTHAVAAAAIGGNQQPRRDRIAGSAELIPPASDALDGEHRCVVTDTEIDPSDIVSDVVDAIWHRLAEFGDDEVMHPNRLWLALGAQLTAAILEVADKLLLLGVNEIAG